MTTIAVVGGESLLGREVHEHIQDAGVGTVELIGAGDSGGVLTELEGEATLLTPLDAERIHGSDIVVCAGDAASTRRAHALAVEASPNAPAVIDLTGALEDLPEARLRAPIIENREPTPAGPEAVHVVAHPAAAVLTAILLRLHRTNPIRHCVVQIFEPASERGQKGLNELQQQVAGLLSFRPLEKKVFDAQIGFNMLPRFGEDAPEHLQDIEAKILRHVTTLLGGKVPMPSVKLIQAPVFHGHTLSLWVDFESRPEGSAVAESLASAQIEVRGPDVEPPTNVGAAGQSGVMLGMIEPDPQRPTAMWLWAVADNYRITADNAVEIARAVAEARK